MNAKRLSTVRVGVIAIACMLCLAMMALVGCSSNDSNNSSSSDSGSTFNMQAGSKFIVGFDQDYPPYGFVGDDGQYTGFDLDLAQEVCKRNGWEFEAQPINWDAKDAELGSGAITCIWNGFTMEGRENDYTFSKPYMKNGQVIVVKKDSSISSLKDLAGKNAVTQTDSAALEVLQGDQKSLADTFASLETLDNYNTAFMNLESGAVDAVACDLSIAEYQTSANPGKYKVLSDYLSTEHYAVGFKKGSDELANKVTETLEAMTKDGTVKTLCKKYKKYGISYDNWMLK